MEPEQYALMEGVERTHWWYVGMRRLVAALLDGQLPPSPYPPLEGEGRRASSPPLPEGEGGGEGTP